MEESNRLNDSIRYTEWVINKYVCMNRTKTSLFAVLVGLVLLVGIAFVLNQQQNRSARNAQESPSTPEQGLKEFYSQELGLAFQYPADWGEVSYRVGRGGAGTAVSGVIRAPGCTLDNGCWGTLEFGSSTRDFEQPRGAGIAETDGYIERDGKHYRLLAGQELLVDYQFEEIRARNISGIIIYGDDRQVDPSTIEEDIRQVIFNVPDSQFTAITFAYSQRQVADDQMRKVLESVELR